MMETKGASKTLMVLCFSLIFSLIASVLSPFPAFANFEIKKTSPTGFNFKVVIGGSDLQKAWTVTGALDYANKAAEWVVNTYFPGVGKAKEIEGISKKFEDITNKLKIPLPSPLPPAAAVTDALLKAGLAGKFALIFREAGARKCKDLLIINVSGPPFPATWHSDCYGVSK